MYFSSKIRFETPRGPAFVDPDQVVIVVKDGAASKVALTSGNHLEASEPAEAIAKRLWRFTNEADNAFFSERHVVGIVPKEGGGCKVLLTGGSILEQPMSPEELEALHRMTNAARNAHTTQG